ncbi:bifunctional 2',3'-cyclic-nucleotide 2'-phosphodiesterase/3'-nucleotidase [Aestuariibius insulae]|uniref:bifunctional 2',3'-cyclic-nucleotide 2'-phosphodiesterase/3'-nucleotidase n=1 Tax=Aestuariibius insulae TaxID=2058287 RepID=UPI00345E7C6E
MFIFDLFAVEDSPVIGQGHGLASSSQVWSLDAALTDHGPPFPVRPGHASLRILGTTDLHGHVMAYDYLGDRPSHKVGLARTARLIDEARQEVPVSVLFDNGDFLNGTAMSDLHARQQINAPHPVIAAMNELGYDAVALGNHEFNYGLETLSQALEDAEFPIVCSNIHPVGVRSIWPEPDGHPLVRRQVIIERRLKTGEGLSFPIKIGVVGLLPPQIIHWDRRHLLGRVTTSGIRETAEIEARALRRRGADIVIALSHSGLSNKSYEPGDENASVAVAELQGIDAVLAGHTHRVFPAEDGVLVDGAHPVTGTIRGTPVVEAGFWGSHMAVIDLELRRTQFGWIVVAGRGEARPIARRDHNGNVHALVKSMPDVEASVASAHDRTLTEMRRPVGRTQKPLHSFFTLLGMDRALKVVADAEVKQVSRLLERQSGGALPLLCATAPAKSGGRGGPDFYTLVPEGPITLRGLSDLYIFPNTMTVLGVSGAVLRKWLEHSAGAFHQIHPHLEDQPLYDAEYPSFNFDVMDGLTYEIDLSQPARYDVDGRLRAPESRRVRHLRYAGRPVRDADRFALATNNYRATGGGSFPGVEEAEVLVETLMTNRDALAAYVEAEGTLDPEPDPVFTFTDLGGVSVIFETSPAARDYLQDMPMPGEDLGNTEEGFARFRLRL